MRVLPGTDPAALAEAAAMLKAGKLVVVPTETVYGLAANALDAKAVARIFTVKGRPSDNPIIVHVPDVAAARNLTLEWPEGADELARLFWPGALTMVLPRSPHVPAIVSGGLPTIAVRVPAHPVSQSLMRTTGLAFAAPSANMSGRPSPTRVEHAVHDLGDKVELYLDGGPCEVGVESTVVGWAEGHPLLFREGGVAREDIEAALGGLQRGRASPRPVSPGMKYRHYAPVAPLRLVGPAALADAWRKAPRGAVALVSEESPVRGERVTVVASREDPAGWARRLFSLLRDADTAGASLIVVEEIPDAGLGAAVLERLRKAAAGGESPN